MSFHTGTSFTLHTTKHELSAPWWHGAVVVCASPGASSMLDPDELLRVAIEANADATRSREFGGSTASMREVVRGAAPPAEQPAV